MKKIIFCITFLACCLPYNSLASNHVALMNSENITYAEDLVISKKYTKQQIDILNKIVYAEAKGESSKGQMAVANVVLNRVNSNLFPNNINSVVFQSGQFTPAANKSSFNSINPSNTVKANVREVLLGKTVINNNVLFFKSKSSSASWGSYKLQHTIGNHQFYSK